MHELDIIDEVLTSPDILKMEARSINLVVLAHVMSVAVRPTDKAPMTTHTDSSASSKRDCYRHLEGARSPESPCTSGSGHDGCCRPRNYPVEPAFWAIWALECFRDYVSGEATLVG
ncbi:hypothetical protein C0993_004869, partial [Termitomyces sp. T159_Od127]